MRSELEYAIEHHDLLLHFQPKLALATGRMVGVEALVRWPQRDGTLALPGQFVPLAVRTGLIGRLTRWVLQASLGQHALWRRAGVHVPVAVNISMSDLLDRRLPEDVERALARWAVPPQVLTLEVGEHGWPAESTWADETARRLRQLGIQIAVDDVTQLSHIPASELKIDRTFLRDVVADPSAVRSTIQLARELGLRVVAEGVEDEPTWEALRRLGCDSAQGYFLGHPVTASTLERWLPLYEGSALIVSDAA